MGGATPGRTRIIAPLHYSANSYKQQPTVFLCAFVVFLLLLYGVLIIYLLSTESQQEVRGNLRIVWVTTVTANDSASISSTLHLLSKISRTLSEYFRSDELINWMVVEEGGMTRSISQFPDVRVNFMHLRADANGEHFGNGLCRQRAVERLRELWTDEEVLPRRRQVAVAVVLTDRLQRIPKDCLSSATRRSIRQAVDSDQPGRICDSFAIAVSAHSMVRNRQNDALLHQYFRS